MNTTMSLAEKDAVLALGHHCISGDMLTAAHAKLLLSVMARLEEDLKYATAALDRETTRRLALDDAIAVKGGTEHAPTQDAYDAACVALGKHRARAETAVGLARVILDAWCEGNEDWDSAHDMTRYRAMLAATAARAECLPSEFYCWNHMDYAPRDRVIFAGDAANGYTAKVIWNGAEWECVDYRDEPTGVGFYPTHWHLIDTVPGVPE
jgi:hypothetical protein